MKVPTPRQLPSGNWFIRLRLGGQDIPITERSRSECVKKAQLIKAEHLAGREVQRKKLPPASDLTLGELIDQYVKKYRGVLSPATVRGYETIRRNRFQEIMQRRARDVRDWQGCIDTELRAVSEKTVVNAWGLLTAALRDAKIPVPEVKLAAVPDAETAYLEPEEIPPFLDAIRGDPCELEMLLELHGLRLSEVQQVIKEDRIDVKRGKITVRGAIVRGSEGFVAKQTNKTKKGTRVVDILIPRLQELAAELRADGGEIPMHSASMILKHVHSASARAGVTDVTNHDLRRTFASVGYSCGIPERLLMELGGWNDAATMHKIYVKLSQRDRRGAADALKDFFRPKTSEARLAAALEKLEALRDDFGDLPELKGVFSAVKKVKTATETAPRDESVEK